MKLINIVAPIYNESTSLKIFFVRLQKVTKAINGYKWNYIFVNDGSDDDSFDILKSFAEKNKAVKIISLSRNFGKEIALTAGLDAVKKGAVIFIDADLEHPPEVIQELVANWENGAEIVATIRKSFSQRSIIKKFGSKLFYMIINKISDTKMHSNTTDFRLLDEKVVIALKAFTERNRMVRGLIDWMGFEKVFVKFDAPKRSGGSPGYGFLKLFRLAMNSFSSFSLLPLRITGYLGLIITFFSGLLLSYMFFKSIFSLDKFFSSCHSNCD